MATISNMWGRMIEVPSRIQELNDARANTVSSRITAQKQVNEWYCACTCTQVASVYAQACLDRDC